MAAKGVSRKTATEVFNSVVAKYGEGAELIEDWTWSSHMGKNWAIVWEGGPYDWTIEFSEWYNWQDVGSPVFVEPYSGWALSIWKR